MQVESQIQFSWLTYSCGAMSNAIEDRDFPVLGQETQSVRLSKSRFVAGVQCLKRLYLQTYAPKAATPVEALRQERRDQGQLVGLLAHAAFPGGATFTSDYLAIDDALAQTAAFLDNPSCKYDS